MYRPLRSLEQGHWFKLICGASFQHLPAVRNLALAYTLAGVDCVDVAADPAVIAAAREGIGRAMSLPLFGGDRPSVLADPPWLMVSLNDGEDPHFRKATFDPAHCPPDCPRPCERICPANAIAFSPFNSGVIEERCYGCGRCIPICPIQQITARSYVSTPGAIAPLVLSGVDAVEIHTQVGRWEDFQRLWAAIHPSVHQLKLVAISCPDGDGLIEYLWALHDLIQPLPCTVVWQTDGRPMSGDIGDGATRAAVKLGQKVLAAGLPGYVQLAGGTNAHTVAKLRDVGLLKENQRGVQPGFPAGEMGRSPRRYIAGVAYGSYARRLLAPVLEQMEQASDAPGSISFSPQGGAMAVAWTAGRSAHPPTPHPQTYPDSSALELRPDLLQQAVGLAQSLVSQLKPMPDPSASRFPSPTHDSVQHHPPSAAPLLAQTSSAD